MHFEDRPVDFQQTTVLVFTYFFPVGALFSFSSLYIRMRIK